MPEPEDFGLPAPPGDDSEETAAELAELRQMTDGRTAEDLAQIYRWSVDESSINTHWHAAAEQVIRAYGLTPPAGARVHALLTDATYCAIIACWRQKWRHLRPRPSDLDPSIDVSVIPVPQHPAYPSGHSTVAGAARKILGYLFPAEAPQFDALGEESGLSRLKAGIHFRSDHTAGLALGERVARALLREARRDGAPQRYERQT